LRFIFGQLVHQEHELPVAGAGDELEFGVAAVADDEARVVESLLAAHALQIGLPTLAVGRVGDHEVELALNGTGRRTAWICLRRRRCSRLAAFALQQQVGLADGVGFVADFLPEQVDGDFLAVVVGQFVQGFLGHGQHAAGAAGAVVEQIGAGLDAVGHGQEQQLGHELDHVARREVLARLFVVLFVEAADQLLEHGAHAVVVQRRQLDAAIRVLHGQRREVDLGVEEVLDQVAQDVGIDQLLDLVAEIELGEDFLHVGRETVEVGDEVVAQALPLAASFSLANVKSETL
jgi:hypothetical protein